MSKVDETPTKRPSNIVRLKIDGTKTTVNTLREQQTAKGVSLICPFPALEVDIPASFGNDDEMVLGAIHRIGVEDDPETGLPRLRLQVRTEDTRATVARDTYLPLLDEVAEKKMAPKEVEADELSNHAHDKGPALEDRDGFNFETDFDHQGLFQKTDIFYRAPDDARESDPGWVGCDEFPVPEAFKQRIKTRRRYKAVRFAVLAFVVGMTAATGYTLQKAGLIDLSSVTARFAGLGAGDNRSSSGPRIAESGPLLEMPAPAVPNEVVETPKIEEIALADNTGESKTLEMAAAESAVAPITEQASYAPTAEDYAEVTEKPERAVETAEASDKDITVILPTRWPVEYTTAYRVRDPNGVVVDVPGGLVKREGWLDQAKEYPMIRSIKAIQRESGARFIVYVHGDLPRFMTSPKAGGVGLRLYHDNAPEETTTVAALEKAE